MYQSSGLGASWHGLTHGTTVGVARWVGRPRDRRRCASSGTSGWCASTGSTPRPASTGRASSGRIRLSGRRRRQRRKRSPTGSGARLGRRSVRSSRVGWSHAPTSSREGSAPVRVGRRATSPKDSASIRLDRLDREDVSRWFEGLATDGRFARRSIVIFRTVLRAALVDAVEEGLLRRSPAARVPMPKLVAKPPREVSAWDEDQVDVFLATVEGHRWAAPLRVAVLYGLRRSELLALKWDDIDLDRRTITIDEGLVEVHGRPVWTEGKNARSRRTFGIDRRHRKSSRIAPHVPATRAARCGSRVARPRHGGGARLKATSVSPGNFDQTLDRLVKRSGLPRLTSHGLRHTAATHMVRQAADVGELPRRGGRARPQSRHAPQDVRACASGLDGGGGGAHR